jgi:hypothetical protein
LIIEVFLCPFYGFRRNINTEKFTAFGRHTNGKPPVAEEKFVKTVVVV